MGKSSYIKEFISLLISLIPNTLASPWSECDLTVPENYSMLIAPTLYDINNDLIPAVVYLDIKILQVDIT